MQVALVHHQLRSSGGMESYLRDLVRGFSQAGDAVEVYAHSVDAALANELRVRVHRVRMPPLPRLLHNAVFSRRVAALQLARSHDLVISLARTTGQHVAVNGGTHPGFLHATQRTAGLRDRVEISLERAALESSPVVIAHSRMLADEIARFYPTAAARVQVVHPPLDAGRYRRAGAAMRARTRSELGLKDDDFAFLFPSMDHARKGLSSLLAAFATLADPRMRLLIAGRPAPRMLAGISSALRARIDELGYVTDMPGLYAATDCTILPAQYEPFGLVIAESLQCGTPVIVGSGAGVADLVGRDDGICVTKGTPAEIASAMLRMREDPRVPGTDFVGRHHLHLADHVAALKRAAGRSTGAAG